MRLSLVSSIVKYIVFSYFDYQMCFLLTNLSIKLLIKDTFEDVFVISSTPRLHASYMVRDQNHGLIYMQTYKIYTIHICVSVFLQY